MRSDGKRVFDRRAFERWLFGTKPLPDGAAFFPNHQGKCPLAWFLMQRYRFRSPNVKEQSASWYWGLTFYEQPLPRWASLYIQRIDALGGIRAPIALERAREAYREALLELRAAA